MKKYLIKVRISNMITLNENDKLEYVSSGLFKSDGRWCHPHRIIDTYEIIFMYDGIAYICEDNIKYTLKKNDILFLEPRKEHYGFCTSEEYVSFAWIHYRTNYDKYKNIAKHSNISNPHALKTLFSQCLHTVNTPIYNPVCADIYTVLFVEEILCNNQLDSSSKTQLASQIKEFISLNIEKDLSVKSIATHFGYHENHISRIFKSAYGILLKKYISNQKLEAAQALLTTTLYTVNQIAQILSFKSENHFIKFFKYHTQITPSEYRNFYINTHVNKS